jgi:hypothetical protein
MWMRRGDVAKTFSTCSSSFARLVLLLLPFDAEMMSVLSFRILTSSSCILLQSCRQKPGRSVHFVQNSLMATMSHPQHFMNTSGETDSVWVHKEPYSNRPHFPKLDKDIEAEVCIIGSGIAGVSSAYELVTRGVMVTTIEAREVVSGKSGRTSGHLSSALDAPYTDIAKIHGSGGAKIAAESHAWALKRVGEISKKLGFGCEYRMLPDYEISQFE